MGYCVELKKSTVIFLFQPVLHCLVQHATEHLCALIQFKSATQHPHCSCAIVTELSYSAFISYGGIPGFTFLLRLMTNAFLALEESWDILQRSTLAPHVINEEGHACMIDRTILTNLHVSDSHQFIFAQ